jgi:hypothetical protein
VADWSYRVGRNLSDIGYGYHWGAAGAGDLGYNLAWGDGEQWIVLVEDPNVVIVTTADPLIG